MKKLFFLLAFGLGSWAATAQNPWQNFTTENSDLKSNDVSSIIVDQQNNVWVAYSGFGGNGEGVSKFDGNVWTHYTTENSGLPNNDIRTLAVDNLGNLWFGCYNAGLVKFDGANWTLFTESNSGLAGDNVTIIRVDNDNNLWIGGYFDGISKFDGTNWTVYNSSNAPFNPVDNCVNSITIHNHTVWVGLGCAGGMAMLNTSTGAWIKYTEQNSGLAHHSVSAAEFDSQDRLWIGYPSHENLLTSFDGTNWQTYSPFESSTGGGVAYNGIVRDRSGLAWAATYHGLYRNDGDVWSKVQSVGSQDQQVSGFNQSLAVDRFRGMWWAEQGHGIWTNHEIQEYPWFEDTGITFPESGGGKVQWVDIDNDTDLDMVVSGAGMHIYDNQNGNYVLRSTGLQQVSGGFAFGDYDNDGDLDVVIGGRNGSHNATELYENQGGFSFVLKQTLYPLANATMAWADIDNDLDLDFVIAGADDENAGDLGIAFRTFVYENVNGSFEVLPSAGITPCTQCALEWADVNGDGKIDLLASGYLQEGSLSRVYLNNGDKTFSPDTESVLENLTNGDAAWGDYDRDGDLDLLLTGFKPLEISGPDYAHTLVYENKNGKLVKRADLSLEGVGDLWQGGSAWADINNDGFLDIIVSGRGGHTIEIKRVFELYINDGQGSFITIPSTFPPLSDTSIDVADFDNDGDLDICFLGNDSQRLKIYRNLLVDAMSLPSSQNTFAQPPVLETLTESYVGNTLTLSWGEGYDNTTPPRSLSYNYYFRNASTVQVSPPAHFSTGRIKTLTAQNGLGQKAILNNFPEGEYFWAVQAVDGGKQGSPFTEEKLLNMIYGPQGLKSTILDATHVKLEWTNYSSVAISNQLERSNKPTTEYDVRASLLPDVTSFVDVNSFILDSIYYYRISAATANGVSQHFVHQMVIPAPPDQVSVEEVNYTTLKLTWNDNSKYETGYTLERRQSGEENFTMIGTLSAEDLTYTDTNLHEFTTYEYRISARNIHGGIYSEIFSGRTNLRPQGTTIAIETQEDEPVMFTAVAFSTSFLDNADGLDHIKIASLPESGRLMLIDQEVGIDQAIGIESLSILRFVPNQDVNGGDSFTFYVSDGKDYSVDPISSNITIHAVNDLPTISAIEDVSFLSTEIGSRTFTINDIDNELTDLTFSFSSSDESIMPLVNISTEGLNNNFTILLAPNSKGGTATVSIGVSDFDGKTTETFDVTVEVITGIEDQFEKLVRVYPNPFIDQLIIEPINGNPVEVSISDMSGRTFKTLEPITQKVIVPLADLAPGLYLLHVADNQSKPVIRKIIKTN